MKRILALTAAILFTLAALLGGALPHAWGDTNPAPCGPGGPPVPPCFGAAPPAPHGDLPPQLYPALPQPGSGATLAH